MTRFPSSASSIPDLMNNDLVIIWFYQWAERLIHGCDERNCKHYSTASKKYNANHLVVFIVQYTLIMCWTVDYMSSDLFCDHLSCIHGDSIFSII